MTNKMGKGKTQLYSITFIIIIRNENETTKQKLRPARRYDISLMMNVGKSFMKKDSEIKYAS